MTLTLARGAFQQGNLAQAEALARAHSQAHPRDPLGWHALGVIRSAAGSWPGAMDAFSRAIRLTGKKVPPEWLLGLSNAALRAGDGLAAQRAAEQATKLAPGLADAWFCLGLALQARDKAVEAAKTYERALAIAPGHAGARGNLAVVLNALGYHPTAADHLRRLVRDGVASPWQIVLLAGLDMANGEVAAARRGLESLPEAARQGAAYHSVIGQIATAEGDTATAVAHLRAALDAEPASTDALLALAPLIDPMEEGETILTAVASALSDAPGDWPRRILLLARATILDRRGAYPAACTAYAEAAAAGRAAVVSAGRGYDPVAEDRVAEAVLQHWSKPERFAPLPGEAPDGLIFVVGMPRSGTTLIEQMLGRADGVFAAGELPDADREIRRMVAQGYPDLTQEALAALVQRLREFYGARLISANARGLVDKLPANYWHVGLLAQAFPGAHFVHAVRDPIDTCLSCWQQSFAFAMQPWQHDFDDLAHCHAVKDRLMAHWEANLPGRILRVAYEDMVADPVGGSKALAAFCGLPWTEAMADPSGGKGPVATASVLQVRRKVYTTSVGRWRRYGDGLAGLPVALARRGVIGMDDAG